MPLLDWDYNIALLKLHALLFPEVYLEHQNIASHEGKYLTTTRDTHALASHIP